MELVRDVGRFDVIGMIGPLVIAAGIRRFLAMRRLFRAEPWDAVVFIDNPGLNLRYAYFARRAGLRVFYYIAPQIWAWRPGRIHWIKQRVDHVLVVLPFEKTIYDNAGIRCTFVGHPLLDAVAAEYEVKELRRRFGLSPEKRVVALLPGSRTREVESLLPILLDAAEKLVRTCPGTQFILAQAPTIPDNLLQSVLRRSTVPVTVVKGEASEVMGSADLVLVASGTATLQAAVIGVPMILLYRTTALTYWLARYLIRVRWIGLVNLVAGRTVVPELIQDDATGQRLYEEALDILDHTSVYDEMKQNLAKVRAALGQPGASARVAEVVLAACRV